MSPTLCRIDPTARVSMTSRTWRSRAANEFSTWWRPMLLGSAAVLLSRYVGETARSGETGIASCYSAVPDRSQPLTAAHRNLPFGTHVRVTRLDTGTPIVVRVNDRGPFIKGRIIDLSRAAAARLGMLGKGIVRVRIEVVPPPTLTAELHSAASTPCGPCRQPLLLEPVSTAPCDRGGHRPQRQKARRRVRDAAESGRWPPPPESYAVNS